MTDRTRLHMPRLHAIELSNFSLYSQRRRIKVDTGSGVFCLAGANGLGKSTFLAALGLGLTGTVAPERPTFKSLPQYYARCLSYAREYFDGRINEKDRRAAEVALWFSVKDKEYCVKRNPFEPESIRYLEIQNADGSTVAGNDQFQSDEQRHVAYSEALTQDIGLSSYPQYVFLHHFLLTFDERRQTLFWDEENTEKVLYLALGVDPDLADKADELRKRAEAEDSLARNAQYDATTARTRLREILKARDSVAPNSQSDEQKSLTDRLDEAHANYTTAFEAMEVVLSTLTDARLTLATYSAKELHAREEYERVFTRGLSKVKPPEQHPLIIETLQTQKCAICSTTGITVVQEIQQTIDAGHCPLCHTLITASEDSSDFQERARALQEADKQLSEARTELQSARERVERLETETSVTKEKFDETAARLRQIESETSKNFSKRTGDTRAGLEVLESQIKGTIDDAVSRKTSHLKKRDEALRGLRPLRQELIRAFAEAELELVPLFQNLAMQFLGLPLDISLSPAGKERARLLLTIKNERRRNGNQLSESQRYFLDIALRMALVIHMSAGESPAPLYIDTPEGSLDIAYESRAGLMFASFSGRGHPLIMTANINTSQLLLRLAEECGKSGMVLVRMTEWTSLSDVQAAEEHRMEDAFRAIETALEAKAATSEVVEYLGRAHE